MQSETRQSNRLARETSPYLLQHAHNPVDWYPWGEEAFAEAQRRDVPIFLSIGYSTCYWCHVMERESFESAVVARMMNERFVNIKVDREERPDVDDIYMTATQVLSGRGGWPMSAFLEPRHLRPFWCGTYFPPEPKMGMPGFPQVLESISEAWRTKREEVVQQSERVAEVVSEYLASRQEPVALSLEQVSKAAQALVQMLDRTWGGFGSAPKFPQPVYLEFLLDVRAGAGDEATRSAVDEAIRLTLDKMAIGGLRDQVGGGFHRYSVDQTWTVPHFEKMLYDNAQLASVYARAARLYGDDFYSHVAATTLGYVNMEMTSPDGGFFSAQDAEVDGHEGANYVWTEDEIRGALGAADADFAMKVYGVDRGSNFRDPHHADAQPVNVLRLDDRPERIAERMGLSAGQFSERLSTINCTLYGVRSGRKQPRLDDKVLTSWNGLMIAGCAEAARGLAQPEHLQAGAKAADFILGHMRNESGLLRSCRDGEARTPAFLEDYACLIAGLLALGRAEAFTATVRAPQESRHIAAARELFDEADRLFADDAGGYFDTRAAQTDLFIRPRTSHDGAIPCGSSVMLNNIIDLHEITGESAYLDRAMRCVASLSAAVAQSPISAVNTTRALLRLLSLGQSERLAALGPPPEKAEDRPDDFTPVEIYASTDRIAVSNETPGHFRLVLKIAEGYHITAADPGRAGEGLTPLRVHVVNGTGIVAYADYPPGQPYGPDGGLNIHTGEVQFQVVVERQGDWSGQPLLAVTFQACTETECMEPTTVELDVAIDRET